MIKQHNSFKATNLEIQKGTKNHKGINHQDKQATTLGILINIQIRQ
jgi:hypothetical protein